MRSIDRRKGLHALFAAAAGAAVLLVSACGGDGAGDPTAGGGGTSAESANQAAVEEAEAEQMTAVDVEIELAQKLDVRRNELGDLDFVTPGADSCTIVVILPSPEHVAMYRGDPPDPAQPVVTNPEGTIGVKISATREDQAACLRAAEVALRDL